MRSAALINSSVHYFTIVMKVSLRNIVMHQVRLMVTFHNTHSAALSGMPGVTVKTLLPDEFIPGYNLDEHMGIETCCHLRALACRMHLEYPV